MRRVDAESNHRLCSTMMQGYGRDLAVIRSEDGVIARQQTMLVVEGVERFDQLPRAFLILRYDVTI